MQPHLELDARLRRHVRKVRLIELAIALGLFALGVLFAIIRETQKVVTLIEPPFRAPYEHVDYPIGLTFAMQFTYTLAVLALLWFALGFLYGKIDTVEVKDDFVTLYRGFASVILYVNGIEQSRSRFYLEGKLSDRSTVTVSLSRNALWAHISFSNGQKSIDL